MMLRSLAQLRAKVVFEGDFPPPTANTTPALADMNARINEGVIEIHRLIVAAAGDLAYRKELSFSTGTNQTDYPLPADFYQLKQVKVLINGGDWIDLALFTNAEESWLQSASPGFGGQPFKYKLLGKQASDGSDPGRIRVLPPPSSAITLKLVYVFGPPVLVLDTDQIDGFAGYEDFAIQFAIRSCATKIEEFEKADRAIAEMGRLRADLLATMRTRDADRPPRVQLTRDMRGGRGRNRFGWGGT